MLPFIKRSLSQIGILLAAALLVSCASSSVDSTTSESESMDMSNAAASTFIAHDESEKKRVSDDALARLPEYDLEGDSVMIVTSNASLPLPEDAESTVDKKTYERLNMLEERFNFKFSKRAQSDAALYKGASEAHRAGLYYADLLYITPSQLWRYADISANIASLPFVTLDAPYYSERSLETLASSGTVYAAIGSSNIDFDRLVGVFFNKETLASITDASLYDEVYSGTWTLERMLELTSAARDGGSVKNGAVSELGLERLIDNLYFSANGYNIETGLSLTPTYTPFDEVAQSCADSIYKLIYGKNGFSRNADARELFADGGSLFLISELGAKRELADTPFNWGILPLPSDDKDARTLMNDGFTVTTVLSSTPDLTRSGLLLESINAALYGYKNEAYMDECMYEAVRDNETLNMIDMIEESAETSFSHMFAGGIKSLDDATYLAVRGTVRTKHDLEYYNKQSKGISELLESEFAR